MGAINSVEDRQTKDELGAYRVVGSRYVPDHHIYPLNTETERAAYFKKLGDMQARAAAIVPMARVMAPGEVRVKRFRTLEEGNQDQMEGMLRTMAFLEEGRVHAKSGH